MELADARTANEKRQDDLTVLVISLILNPLGKVDPQAQRIVTDLIEVWTQRGLDSANIEALLRWMRHQKIAGIELVILFGEHGECITPLAQYIMDGPQRTLCEKMQNDAELIRDKNFTEAQKAFAGTEEPHLTMMVLCMHEWAIRSLEQAGLEATLTARQIIVDGAIAKWGKTAAELHRQVVERDTGEGGSALFEILDGLGVEYEESARVIREEIIRDLSVSLSDKFTDARAATNPPIQKKMLRDISTVIGSVFNKSSQVTPLRAFVCMQLCSMNAAVMDQLMDYYAAEKAQGFDVHYTQQVNIVSQFYREAQSLRASKKRTDRKQSVRPLIGLALTCRFDQLIEMCQTHGFLVKQDTAAQQQDPR